jgi:protein TonB
MSDLWDEDGLRARKRPQSRIWAARIVVGVALTAFVAVLAWGAYSLLAEKTSSRKQVVRISLLPPPPPPPLPPPPQVKPPEPEVKEEVKVPEPEPQQAEEAPPAGDQLGLDANGSGGNDGFGLAAKKGGRDITTLGGEGSSNRAQFAWFTGQVQAFLQEQFQKNDKLRRADYRVVMRVWFGRDGKLERYELVGSSGNQDIDQSLKFALSDLPRMRQAPPADLPQPIKLRVTSRGAG